MQTGRFTQLTVLSLAILFTMLMGIADAQENPPLVGTWDVILRFPASTCNSACTCPGNTPDIPIPTLQTFLGQGGMLWSGSALAVGTGHGTWEELGDNNYTARFKFFIFDLTTGFRTASEVVTKDIVVTGPDTFEATSTYDFLDGEGNLLASGCIINETGARF